MTAPSVVTDHHVHLGLFDAALLRGAGIGAVVDLGWSPDIGQLAAAAPVDVAWAGCFLTAPGGYPSDREWAPPGSTAPVHSPAQAREVVEAQLAGGASVVKVVLNSDAGPTLDEATVAAVVEAAPVPVVAHVEGSGTAARAIAAGVDVLAHTPWTELLPDDLVAEAATRMAWISTLDIHGYGSRTREQEVAVANLRRFHEAGGRVLYGTDLGNGPLPVGVNDREVALLREAGLAEADVRAAMTDPWPHR